MKFVKNALLSIAMINNTLIVFELETKNIKEIIINKNDINYMILSCIKFYYLSFKYFINLNLNT